MINKSFLLILGIALTGSSSEIFANEGGLLSISNAHSAGITSSGTVYTSGRNNGGQLGNGTTTDSSLPVAVPGLTDCIQVVAGASAHTLALKADGTVWAWGGGTSGQLGDGTSTNRSSPVQVTGLSGVISLGAGTNSSFALKSNGTVWAWGFNGSGQLGDGTTINRSSPVQVSGLTSAKAIGVGSSHCLALLDNGTVKAWGYNGDGELGDGTSTNRSTPVTVPGLSGITKISAGWYHSMALKGDGTLRAWGLNLNGQVGVGTSGLGSVYFSPQTLTGISQVVSISGGGLHSVAIKSDGALWAWGDDSSGALGDSAPASSSNIPVYVAGFPSDASMVAAGGGTTIALESNGTIWAWGGNTYGGIGDGTTTTRFLPSFVGIR